ncbi:MAG: gamma-glutamylcyclotransferase [Aeromicrobium erythreum]
MTAHLVFSYGTLQLDSVQREVFGRPVPVEPAAVLGHVLGEVVVDDPAVIAASGTEIHPLLLPSDDPSARVEGVVLRLDDAQLAAADAYEVDAYARVRVPLEGGGEAWVYGPAAP